MKISLKINHSLNILDLKDHIQYKPNVFNPHACIYYTGQWLPYGFRCVIIYLTTNCHSGLFSFQGISLWFYFLVYYRRQGAGRCHITGRWRSGGERANYNMQQRI